MGTQKQKLWILTELFYPDEISTAYIMTEIALAMRETHNVNVICGHPNVKDRLSNGTIPNDIKIYRCGKSTTGGKNLVFRLYKMISLSLSLLYNVIRRVKKNEHVFIVTNPALLLILIGSVKKIKKFHLHLLVHDIFPENAYAAGVFKSKNSILYKLLLKVFSNAYNSADDLIVLGRDMRDVVNTKLKIKKNIAIIENWADVENIQLRLTDWSITGLNLKDKIVLQYAGNVGRVQGLQELLASLLESKNEKLHLCIWGDGSAKESLEKFVKENEMDNVSFHGAYKREQQLDILSACHVAVISLSDNMYGLGVPSKSYNIMAAGKSILYIGNPKSEIALTIKEYQLGYSLPNNKNTLVNFLKDLGNGIPPPPLLNSQARFIAEHFFSKEIILSKFKTILSNG